MGHRTQLNIAFFNGSLLLAAVFGGLAQSWIIFVIALIVLLIGNLLAHEIRPGGQSRHRHDRR